MNGRVLLLLIEPTTYALAFVDNLRQAWQDRVDLLFLSQNRSQQWNIDVSKGEMLPSRFFRALGELWRRLRPENYVLVHLAGWSEPLILFAWLICRLRGIPFTIQSDTPLRFSPRWLKALTKKFAYLGLFRLPSMFLPAGTRQALYLKYYGVSDERIRICQMTVDVECIMNFVANVSPTRRHQLRQQLGFSEDQVVFLSVGRLEPFKGIRVLIKAFCGLSANMAHIGLVIAGDGSLYEEVAQTARQQHNIRYTGRLDGNALWDCYAIADVFVFPSLVEPWGLVLNEAMASGLPAVVSDQVGCADDLVLPRRTGLLVSADSVEALTEAMETLAQNPAMRKTMAEETRRHIRSWTLKNQAARVIEAWQQVISH